MRMLKTKCQNAETDKNRNMKHSEQLLFEHQAAEKKYKILAVLDDTSITYYSCFWDKKFNFTVYNENKKLLAP